MRIVFMGTSEYAVPVLQAIINNEIRVAGIVTKPDRPAGRGGRTCPTPVKQTAMEYNIPVFETNRIKDSQAIERVKEFEADLIAVVSFGQIIPGELLDYPGQGCINLHPSLLPHYRGPAPIQRALMAGETKTGVTTMFLDEGLDTGDIIMQKEVPIPDLADYGELEMILAQAGAALLVDTIKMIEKHKVISRPQCEEAATYAPLITAQDEKINWTMPADRINNIIRALSPFPGAYASMGENRFKIYRARVLDTFSQGKEGEIKELTRHGMAVFTGSGVLEILEVQREGKKRMSCPNFLQGFRLKPGDLLDIN